MLSHPRIIAGLRQKLAFPPGSAACRRRASTGAPGADRALGGGLITNALHEVYAASGWDAAAASGFSAGLALRAARGRPVIWIFQEMFELEAGRPNGPGLKEFGLDPARAVFVRARDAAAALRAGAEAARSPAAGAVILALWGAPAALDLTASRRLALAAETSGATLILLRAAAEPEPSAALTRWRISALPSRGLEADAPGTPAFNAALTRQRGGVSGLAWRLEWNRDQQCFDERRGSFMPAAEPALPRAQFPLPQRGAGDAAERFRKAG